jgi:BlaI family penicillinase repressor
MKKDLKSYILTRQELRIMKIIWERGEATVRDVYDILSARKSTAYTTVLTLMQILEKKGALDRRKTGRSYLYSPIFSRRQATRNQVNDLLDRFFDGNPNKLIETIQQTSSGTSHPKSA